VRAASLARGGYEPGPGRPSPWENQKPYWSYWSWRF